MKIKSILEKKSIFFRILQNGGVSSKNFNILIFLIFLSSIFELLGLGLILPALIFFVRKKNIFEENIIFNEYFSQISEINIIFILCFAIIFIFFLKFLFLNFIKYQHSKFIFNFNSNLSNKIFQKYIYDKFEEHTQSNSSIIAKNIQSEASVVAQGFLGSVLNLTIELVLSISVLGFLFFFYPVPTLISAIFCCFILIFYQFLLKKKISNLGHERVKIEAVKYKYLLETFSGIKEIIINNKINFFINKFQKINFRFNNIGRKQLFLNSIPSNSVEFITVIFLSLTILIYYLFNKEFEEILIMGGIFTFALFKLIPSAIRINNSMQLINYYSPSLIIIFNLLKDFKIITNVNKNSSSYKLINFDKSIKINNVKYNYLSGKFNLEIDSFEIPKNKIVGIIGESGSGKSTLVNILTGLLDVSNGQILIDNINLNNKNILRDIIGYVAQDVYIMNDSLRNNVAFGVDEESIDNKKIDEVCKIVKLKLFVEKLDKGYDTILGDRGLSISGGEKQRIGIARALYKNPKIIILDESTSGLDRNTEISILDDILTSDLKKTVILISHKDELINKYCDETYSLVDGKVNKIN
jgi:ABC-type bacteriocin/lantibiotic exporter with double-glycine peptidase domain